MKTICFSSLKGGSGKSSLSVLTAERLCAKGMRVLCLDMDIQNSLSYQLTKGMAQIDLSKNMYQALLGNPLASQRQRTGAPKTPDFVLSDLRLLDIQDRVAPMALRHALEPLAADYDFVIIDSAPTYNALVTAAYCASDLVVIPVELSLFDLKSLHFLFAKLRELGLSGLDARVLVNKFEAPRRGDTLTGEYLALLDSNYGSHVLPMRIPFSNQLRAALDTGAPIPKGALSKALDELARSLAEGTP